MDKHAIKKACIRGIVRGMIKKAYSEDAIAAARAAEDRSLGKYRAMSDAALAALQRGTAYVPNWFGKITEYPSMGGRSYKHFSESAYNRGMYGDISRAFYETDPDFKEEFSKLDPDLWWPVRKYLKGMQPYMDKRHEDIMNDPWSWSKSNLHRLRTHTDGSIEGFPLLEAIYDSKHKDSLQEASLRSVMPRHARDAYEKARAWGAFNPAYYEKNYKAKDSKSS